ncbi:efflux RND transporter periplasmic adaptor subunit [Mucilaginibacter auburnensis]|uniref:Cobalt-zinc-cadmium efflux system membrane fusion protein n=1 Tax=Mucilaginibacter auburnensis TaxID=1457233 RepID=A0A2H9VQI4_9SPHI|nr:efflux RND transporter periplasmic adaptor subunit [Mucilaginibacter auburnensis]PJJ83079.1 cobalt-zinc-cadmium efflux system membrane fusion protein [Mucilaginibacter auburnensis]
MKKGILFMMTIATLGIVSCEEKKTGTMETKQVCVSDSLAKMISIDTARTSPITNELKLTGEVSFDESKVVKVFPFASGQVMGVKVSLGDKVSRGQVLATIRSADVAGNYADLTSSKADLAISKRQLQQAEYLYKNGISSERDYTEAKENYNKAIAENRKVEDQIAINGGGNTNAAGMLVVKAPRDGYIVEMNISAGNFIRQDNSSALFVISDMKDVWIKANVYETDIAKVKNGYTAYVNTLAYPDKTFKGKVDNVSSVLDPDTKVMTVRIALPNTEMLLKPEMFANVRIVNEDATTATSIPSRSVIFDNGKNYVIAYKSACDLQVREVSILKTVEDTTYLFSGLKAGEKVVAKNQLLLYNALTQN